MKNFLRNPWVSGVCIGLIVLLVGYYVFGIGKSEPVTKETKNYAPQTMSGSQDGIQIQGDVKVGIQPRVLTQEIENRLIKNLDKNQNITIEVIAGNSEASHFANQIRDFLLNNGYSIKRFGAAFFPFLNDNLHIQNNMIFVSAQ